MSIFTKILEKIGLHKEKPSAEPVSAKPAASTTSAAPRVIKDERVQKDDRAFNRAPAPSAPKAISDVDVVANLEKLAAANPARLDWKVSIVDLLKLLGLDSSFNARKELAVELGCPADMMNDSAKMNTWLHKTVLKKIAENGGNIPKALLD